MLINSIDRDGSKKGYDFKILDKIKKISFLFLWGCRQME